MIFKEVKKVEDVKENAQPKLWQSISGKMNIFLKHRTAANNDKYISFSTSIGRKNDKDEYSNVYFDVAFKKGTEPYAEKDGIFTINVKQGFLTVRTYKDGSNHHAIMVLDFDYLDEEKQQGDNLEQIPF